MRAKRHNGIISFWKFAFSLLIVLFHSHRLKPDGFHYSLFIGGAIGVEFFFLVSGYLMCKKALSGYRGGVSPSLGEENFRFIWKKIKGLFPYILVFAIPGFITKAIYNGMTIKDYVLSIWDLTFLRMAGFEKTSINDVAWYISAMLICMIILYPLIRKYGENYLYTAAPFLVIFIAGWLSRNAGGYLRDSELWMGFAYKGTIRAFLELNLGAFLYPLCEKLKKVDFTALGKAFLTALEIGGFLVPFFLSEFVSNSKRYDFVVLAILALSVCIAFSEQTLELDVCCNRLFYHLEKLSLAIYLCQRSVLRYVECDPRFETWTYQQRLILYLIIVLVGGELLMFLIETWKKRKTHFVRDLMIQKEPGA